MIATPQLDRSGTGAPTASAAASQPNVAKSSLIATSRLPILPQCHPDAAERERMIQEAAYFLALRRGFAPGHELDDWLAAERDFSLDPI